jgi:hypothetical protein
MRAAVRARFAPEDVVEVREIDKPVPEDDEVLVRVRAASLNIADWYGVVGRPVVGRVSMGLRGPKTIELGIDYAGTVEAVGAFNSPCARASTPARSSSSAKELAASPSTSALASLRSGPQARFSSRARSRA